MHAITWRRGEKKSNNTHSITMGYNLLYNMKTQIFTL